MKEHTGAAFRGVWTMLATPFDRSGEVNFEAMERLIHSQLTAGISGLLALGSTGEFYALSAAERKQILAFVKRQAGGIPLVAGINGGSTREIISHARAAAELGYRHVLLAPPYYSLPAPDHLIKHFTDVANAVSIDIILYDNPAQVGVQIGLDVLQELTRVKNIIGIKEASGAIARFAQIRERFGDRYEVIGGVDDLALDAILWGSECWMSGPSNFIPRQLLSIHTQTASGDIAQARASMMRILPLIRHIEAGKYVAKIKYCCRVAGLDIGEARPPIYSLSPEEQKLLSIELDNILGDQRA